MESDHFQQQSRKCFLNGRIVLHPPLRLLPTAVPIIQNREPLEDGNIPSRHGACSLLAVSQGTSWLASLTGKTMMACPTGLLVDL